MTSQKSFSRKLRLMQACALQNKYAAFLYVIIFLLTSSLPAYLTYTSSLDPYGVLKPETIPSIAALLSGTSIFNMLALLLLGISSATLAFHYLYGRSSTAFYHSLPFTRGALYAIRFSAGFALYLFPALFTALINIAIAAACGILTGAIFAQICYGLLISILLFLTVYSVGTFCAVLSGNFFAQICLHGFIYLVYPVTYFVYTSALSSWFTTFSRDLTFQMQYVMPIYRLVNLYPSNEFSFGWAAILYTIGYTLLFALLGYLAYRVRKSENTGKFLAFPWIGSLLKYYVTAVGAVGISILFYHTASRSYVASYISLILAAILLFAIIQCVLDKSFRAMFSHRRGFCILLAALVLLVSAGMFDWLHYDTYVPDASKVRSVSLNLTDSRIFSSGSEMLTYRDRENVEAAIALLEKTASAIKDGKTADAASGERMVYFEAEIQTTFAPFKIKRVYRSANASDCEAFLNAVHDTPEYREQYVEQLIPDFEDLAQFIIEKYSKEAVSVDFLMLRKGSDTSENAAYRNSAPKLLAALKEDIQNTPYSEIADDIPYATIQFLRNRPSSDPLTTRKDYYGGARVPIYKSYEKTISVLQSDYPDALHLDSISSLTLIPFHPIPSTADEEGAETTQTEVSQPAITITDPQRIDAILNGRFTSDYSYFKSFNHLYEVHANGVPLGYYQSDTPIVSG